MPGEEGADGEGAPAFWLDLEDSQAAAVSRGDDQAVT